MKNLRVIFAVFYDIMSLFFCIIFILNIVYEILPRVYVDEASVGIIGGADLPTFTFLIENIFKSIFPLIFILSNLVRVCILIIYKFKKIPERNIKTFLCILT